MDRYRGGHWSRREFLGGLALAGTAGLIGLTPEAAAADPPPETKTIRLLQLPELLVICYAPMLVAEELLRGEGFSDVRYVKRMPADDGIGIKTMVAGQADMQSIFAPDLITALDGGAPVVGLMGLHGGCLELVGSERVRTIRDLKGKRIAVVTMGGVDHVFLSTMLAYIGLNPSNDVQWVPLPPPATIPHFIHLLAEGEADALLAWPPIAQEMRAKGIGHVLLSTAKDPPWSQYFCCMVAARKEFVQKNPAATKRALRAILKADQLCTLDPERSARVLVEKSYTPRYDYALQSLKDVPYSAWRDYNPEATVRFHALRMREIGLIKSTPQKIIAQGTDWRFFNELKKELKA